jgi:hypothetical protein
MKLTLNKVRLGMKSGQLIEFECSNLKIEHANGMIIKMQIGAVCGPRPIFLQLQEIAAIEVLASRELEVPEGEIKEPDNVIQFPNPSPNEPDEPDETEPK